MESCIGPGSVQLEISGDDEHNAGAEKRVVVYDFDATTDSGVHDEDVCAICIGPKRDKILVGL